MQILIRKVTTSACILMVLNTGLSACVPQAAADYPVVWYQGFTMPDLLAEPAQAKSKDDLNGLLTEDWYSPIDVVGEQDATVSTWSNCNDYLRNGRRDVRTVRDYEMGPFLEIAVMCRATKLLAEAEPASESYLPAAVITTDSPGSFPADIALQLSAADAEATRHTAQRWSDINSRFHVVTDSVYSAVFNHDGGRQELELIGRGDFNADGIEDAMIISRDSAPGGDFFNIRLFVLSVGPQGRWSRVD
ncbi:hypothetical protein ACXYTJ_15410 [Gilvimarinus sp. F26214L]|uniref:hypothetical protein n=1 Tax=Gilvimarinus sp. DZF01 TaxID=3461371 RepID=UPI004045A2CC